MIKIEKFYSWQKMRYERRQSREETPRNSKHEIFTFLFRGFFFLSWIYTAAKNKCGSLRIRIHNTVYEVGIARLLGTYNTCARYSTLQKLQKYSSFSSDHNIAYYLCTLTAERPWREAEKYLVWTVLID
jgi:hypothetical protein